jgi:hypothetical protein
MRILCFSTGATWAALSIMMTSSFAASNDLELIIRSFPEITASRYRPDLAARSANALISAGEQAACDALGRISSPNHARSEPGELIEFEALNRKICHVCRLLFVPKNAVQPLRPPKLGAPVDLPYESMDPLSWPCLPFVITDGIPLSMNLGYAGSGVPERAQDYLAYCRSNGTFRVETFAQPSPESTSNALSKVFSSVPWRTLRWKDSGLGWSYDINEHYAKELLWEQVENMRQASKAGGARKPTGQ